MTGESKAFQRGIFKSHTDFPKKKEIYEKRKEGEDEDGLIVLPWCSIRLVFDLIFFFSIFYYSFGYDCSQIGCITATTTLFIKGQLNIDLCWEKKQKGPTEKKGGQIGVRGWASKEAFDSQTCPGIVNDLWGGKTNCHLSILKRGPNKPWEAILSSPPLTISQQKTVETGAKLSLCLTHSLHGAAIFSIWKWPGTVYEYVDVRKL